MNAIATGSMTIAVGSPRGHRRGERECQQQHGEGAERHHVGMGEVGEAQDAVDQRHADGADGVDAAGDAAGHHHVVEEIDQLIHDEISR
nr:hypothetical protein [Salinicola acroporae]